MTRRPPTWACDSYTTHGASTVCPKCLRNFAARGADPNRRDDWPPPRANFGRGWLSVGATHLFAATAATLFVAQDGARVLAQTACGVIVDVTRAYAPRRTDLCSKCMGVIKRATLSGKINGPHAEVALDAAVHGISPPSSAVLRLYRGLKGAYDPARVARDGFAGADFTDCPYQALKYAAGSRGVVLVLDVPENLRRLTEAYWTPLPEDGGRACTRLRWTPPPRTAVVRARDPVDAAPAGACRRHAGHAAALTLSCRLHAAGCMPPASGCTSRRARFSCTHGQRPRDSCTLGAIGDTSVHENRVRRGSVYENHARRRAAGPRHSRVHATPVDAAPPRRSCVHANPVDAAPTTALAPGVHATPVDAPPTRPRGSHHPLRSRARVHANPVDAAPRPRRSRVHANPDTAPTTAFARPRDSGGRSRQAIWWTPPRPRRSCVHANLVDAAPIMALACARDSGGRRSHRGARACTRIRWTPPRPRLSRVHATPPTSVGFHQHGTPLSHHHSPPRPDCVTRRIMLACAGEIQFSAGG